jgi:transcriptional regulator with XRE-family HTH domain
MVNSRGYRVDVCLIIKERLEELGFEQKDLAAAAQVTESYVSQLLTRKKLPPAPDRTDIYEKIGAFLELPSGKLAKLADAQRKEELKRGFEDPPAPLFADVRELILRKCAPEKRRQVQSIFEKQPFGELERLVTQKLLDVIKGVAREELESEKWLRSVGRLSGRSYKQTRVTILEFLDTDVFHLSSESCVSFLDPLLESWDVDLASFGIGFVLNHRLVRGTPKRFEFIEKEPGLPQEDEPGFTEFLQDALLSGHVTQDEIEFLRRLRFKGRRPSPLYYYRELQNLRDPLHFRSVER